MSFLAPIFSAVSDLFGLTPKKPPAPQTLAPTDAQIADKENAAAREQTLRAQRGRTSNILTGAQGLEDMGTTSKTLLGQ